MPTAVWLAPKGSGRPCRTRKPAINDKDGNECFSFGKHKGKKVTEILETEPGYFGWLLNADFPLYTKKVLTAIKLRAFNQKL